MRMSLLRLSLLLRVCLLAFFADVVFAQRSISGLRASSWYGPEDNVPRARIPQNAQPVATLPLVTIDPASGQMFPLEDPESTPPFSFRCMTVIDRQSCNAIHPEGKQGGKTIKSYKLFRQRVEKVAKSKGIGRVKITFPYLPFTGLGGAWMIRVETDRGEASFSPVFLAMWLMLYDSARVDDEIAKAIASVI